MENSSLPTELEGRVGFGLVVLEETVGFVVVEEVGFDVPELGLVLPPGLDEELGSVGEVGFVEGLVLGSTMLSLPVGLIGMILSSQ